MVFCALLGVWVSELGCGWVVVVLNCEEQSIKTVDVCDTTNDPGRGDYTCCYMVGHHHRSWFLIGHADLSSAQGNMDNFSTYSSGQRHNRYEYALHTRNTIKVVKYKIQTTE